MATNQSLKNISINDKSSLIFNSPQETANFANTLARELQPGDVVAFYGDLGSGKTFLIKHICSALQVIEEPTSPSFTLINEYHTRRNFNIYHFDFYRLEHEGELANLGIEDFFYDNSICLIEWADRIKRFLPQNRFDIFIRFIDQKPGAREVEIFRKP
jgi:tRNA threonylcarbamoyladenosine biosynthesis protein TsaE